jgi:hypothetical protein
VKPVEEGGAVPLKNVTVPVSPKSKPPKASAPLSITQHTTRALVAEVEGLRFVGRLVNDMEVELLVPVATPVKNRSTLEPTTCHDIVPVGLTENPDQLGVKDPRVMLAAIPDEISNQLPLLYITTVTWLAITWFALRALPSWLVMFTTPRPFTFKVDAVELVLEAIHSIVMPSWYAVKLAVKFRT